MLSTMKHLSLAVGMYRPARILNRQLRPDVRRAWREEVSFYRNLLPDQSLCFDIGAHFGAKSEALLQTGASVVAFEPNPAVLSELTARCGGNPHWSLVTTALGSAPALLEMNLHHRSGESSFDPAWKGGAGFIARMHVPVMTLDAAIEAFGVPWYCKIDVEGWEEEVLRGLNRPIPLISFEFHINEEITPRSRRCLQRLSDFGPAMVNVTPAESSVFHLPQWVPLDEFVDWYPGDLERSLPLYPVGDIYVYQGKVPPGGTGDARHR